MSDVYKTEISTIKSYYQGPEKMEKEGRSGVVQIRKIFI